MSDPKIERAVGPDAIFISYRRGDTAYPAGWLYHQLVGHFGVGQVFKDVDSIELGSDFVNEITTAVASCHCLLALIGRDWLTSLDGRGRRRLDDPADFVRLEIEAALTRDVRVIPVLVEDATMPYADELPPTLAPITRRQALVLSPTRFTADIAKLITVLERTFAEAAAARDAAMQATVEDDRREALATTMQEPAEAATPAVERPAVDEAPEHEPDVTPYEAPEARRLAPDVPTPTVPGPPPAAAATAVPAPVEPPVVELVHPAAQDTPKPGSAATDTADRTSRRQKLLGRGILAAPILLLLALFLPWTSDETFTRDGFSSPLLLVALILLVSAAWLQLPGLGAPVRTLVQLATAMFGFTGLALVCTVLAFLQARSSGLLDTVGFGLGQGSDRSAHPGAYVGLVVALGASVLAGLRRRAARRSPDEPTPPPVEGKAQSSYGGVLVVLFLVAILGVTVHPAAADNLPAPYAGERAWWGFYGNNLDTTLELTNPLNLNGAATAELTAQVNYDAEEGYDFLYGEVSIDGRESWARLNGTVAGESIWSASEGDVEGISGKSGDADEDGETDWVPLKYDLSPLEGESEVWFRFRYITDSSSVSRGFFIDDVVIAGDLTMVVSDGAESDDNGPWTADGFVKSP